MSKITLGAISDWGKAVEIEMILRDMSYKDLADAVGLTRGYLSGLINGRIYSEQAMARICDFLSLPNGNRSFQGKYTP